MTDTPKVEQPHRDAARKRSKRIAGGRHIACRACKGHGGNCGHCDGTGDEWVEWAPLHWGLDEDNRTHTE